MCLARLSTLYTEAKLYLVREHPPWAKQGPQTQRVRGGTLRQGVGSEPWRTRHQPLISQFPERAGVSALWEALGPGWFP